VDHQVLEGHQGITGDHPLMVHLVWKVMNQKKDQRMKILLLNLKKEMKMPFLLNLEVDVMAIEVGMIMEVEIEIIEIGMTTKKNGKEIKLRRREMKMLYLWNLEVRNEEEVVEGEEVMEGITMEVAIGMMTVGEVISKMKKIRRNLMKMHCQQNLEVGESLTEVEDVAETILVEGIVEVVNMTVVIGGMTDVMTIVEEEIVTMTGGIGIATVIVTKGGTEIMIEIEIEVTEIKIIVTGIKIVVTKIEIIIDVIEIVIILLESLDGAMLLLKYQRYL
jgi:hypothetical protein